MLDAGADRLHHLEVDPEEVVTAHAGLARHAGGDDDDVAAIEIRIGLSALIGRIEPVDRRGFGDVEPFALRQALGDVEHHHVAELLEADEMGERAADLACADEAYLVARHGEFPKLRNRCSGGRVARSRRGLVDSRRWAGRTRTF